MKLIKNNRVKVGERYESQINITTKVKWFEGNTERTFDELPALAKDDETPVHYFGATNFNGAFRFGFEQLPIPDEDVSTGWDLIDMGIWGVKAPIRSITIPLAWLSNGALYYVYQHLDPGLTVWTKVVEVQCLENAYGTLLEATMSNKFEIEGIRYDVKNSDFIPQFDNEILLGNLSLFGRNDVDKVSPLAYKDPVNNLLTTIDVGIAFDINKEAFYGTYLKPNVNDVMHSLFVINTVKN